MLGLIRAYLLLALLESSFLFRICLWLSAPEAKPDHTLILPTKLILTPLGGRDARPRAYKTASPMNRHTHTDVGKHLTRPAEQKLKGTGDGESVLKLITKLSLSSITALSSCSKTSITYFSFFFHQ